MRTTKRDMIRVDLTDPEHPIVLVPLTPGQLADLKDVCEREAAEYEDNSRSMRAFITMSKIMAMAIQQIHVAKATKQAELTGVEDPTVAQANEILRMAVNQITSGVIGNVLRVDTPTAKRIHSLLRNAKVAP